MFQDLADDDTAVTAGVEVTTAEALRKQYNVADSAKATGFPMQLGTNKASTPAKISAKAIRCSFLVEHASDQPPLRHCLAKKGELLAFTGLHASEGKCLLRHGQTLVSLRIQSARVAIGILNRLVVIVWM